MLVFQIVLEGFHNFIEFLYCGVITLLWRFFPTLQLQAVRRFQSIEADGVWHLHQILRRNRDPIDRAAVFQHLLEEESHADLFREVFQNDSNQIFQPILFARTSLPLPLEKGTKDPALSDLFLYVHVGEESATRRFRSLCKTLPEGELSRALQRIVKDEEGHIGLTDRLARKLGVSTTKLRAMILWISIKRFSDQAQQNALRVTNAIGLSLLSLTYLCFGFLGAPSARAALKQRLVRVDNNSLKRFSP